MIHCPGCGEENPPRFKLCGYCGTPLAAAAAPSGHGVRKTVTLVFSDLKGSTALGERLDAETLHELKARYFDAMAAEIARHGGKVEKYVGDAIMAVFGLPRTHEDDALRAVRAAVGMRHALARVNAELQARYGVALAQRIGVNTGEVVANDDPGADQKLATGDAVNLAARLEQAAPEDQIYLGEATYRLVRDAVEVEAVAPLELKGKAQPVGAWRLVSAPGLDGNLRRSDTPIVGREAELRHIDGVYHEVVGRSVARLVTVIGDAGVGKSRLVHEVLTRVTGGATVLRGRCLPYGDGITFWPLRVMLGGAGISDDDSPETAHAKLMQFLGDREVVDRVAAATGLSAATYPLHEVYWAARRTLEILAAAAPVVAMVDDIHWAEPAFLELLEHVLATSRDAPILLIATARHDLLEKHPQWGEQPGVSRITLQPLSAGAAEQVVANLLGGAGLPADVLARIVDTAEGNPLYVEQLLSMLIDRGAVVEVDGRWVRTQAAFDIEVPPTIHALLEARLDQLDRAERATVEPASVMGLEFPLSGLHALAPDAVRASLDNHLAALTRKEFVHLSFNVDASARYRFHHQLVRDTVYNGLLKRARAQLHIDFVRWGDKVSADRDRALEFEEILGYHLEQAARYLRELGRLDERGAAVAADASQRLGRAAKRAFARSDMRAAANLYGRAVDLAEPDGAARRALLPELGETLFELGDFAQARQVLAEALACAQRAGDRTAGYEAQLIGMLVRRHSADPGDWSGDAIALAEDAIASLATTAAHDVLALAWRMVAQVHGVAGRHGLSSHAVEQCIEHARRAGNQRLLTRSGLGLSISALFGPTPVPQAIEQCRRLIEGDQGDRQVGSMISCKLAVLHAMNGDFDVARSLYRDARAAMQELGHGVRAASMSMDLAAVELLAGDLGAAEREVRADSEFLQRMGETFLFATMTALQARLVRDQGRDGEALELAEAARAAAAPDDVDAQLLWRATQAPILARQGATAHAETLVREALDLARQTEAPALHADVLSELAEVLALAGRRADARQAIDEAVMLYQSKGDRVSAARAAARAAGLGGPG